MAGVSLNDVVSDFGATRGVRDYGPAKSLVMGGLDQDTFMAGYPSMFFNQALLDAATVPAAMNEAALYLDAKHSVAGEPRVINRGAGDVTGLSGAVIYDGAAAFPGFVGNYLSVPDEAALDIAGDIEIVFRWSRGETSLGSIVTKGTWGIYQTTADRFVFYTSSGPTFYTSTAHPFGTDVPFWVKFTRVSSTGEVNWSYASDSPTEPTSWTFLSSLTSGPGALVANASALEIGGKTISGADLKHKTYRTVIRDGIDGTTVLDVDLATTPDWSSSFTATTGQTVTLTTTAADYGAPTALDATYGSVLGAYIYDGAAVLPGVDSNYLSVPNAAGLFPSGDIELRVTCVKPTSGLDEALITTDATVSDRGYTCRFYGALPSMELMVSHDGSSYNSGATSAAPAPDGVLLEWRARYTSATGATNFAWRYPGDTTWNDLGGSTAASSGPVVPSAADLRIGHRTSAFQPFNGRITKASVLDGFDGTAVLDVDLAGVADYVESFTAATGQTVTVVSTSVDTNDPLLLTHDGENYVVADATQYSPLAVNGFSYPANTPIVDLQWRGLAVDGQQSAGMGWWGSTATRSVYVRQNSSGTLYANWSSDGVHSSGGEIQGAVAAPDSADTFRVTIDATTTSTLVDFYYAFNGGPWQLLESRSTTSTGAGIYAGGDRLTLGGIDAAAGYHIDRLYWAKALDGIDGTPFFEFNGSDIVDSSATSFTATSGQTVDVLRGTSGRKTVLVTRPTWLFGTDDYMEVADNALLNFDADTDFTLLVLGRQWSNTAGTYHPWLTKKAGVGTASPAGWTIFGTASDQYSRFEVADGVTLQDSANILSPEGTEVMFVGVREGDDLTWRTFSDGLSTHESTVTSTAIDTTNSTALRVGGLDGIVGGQATDAEIIVAAVWRRALTADEVDEINFYFTSMANVVLDGDNIVLNGDNVTVSTL